MGSSRTVRTHLQLHGTLQLLPTLCQTQFLGQGSTGCTCQGGRTASPLHEPPPPSLQQPLHWKQGQPWWGPGGLGRQGSCRKGLREMTGAGQDVPHHKAAREDSEGRKGTKICNIPTSLERVTGVTTSHPSPGGGWGQLRPCPSWCHCPCATGSSWALSAPHGCWAPRGGQDLGTCSCTPAPLEPGMEAPGH